MQSGLISLRPREDTARSYAELSTTRTVILLTKAPIEP
jgi:hypothetical protein